MSEVVKARGARQMVMFRLENALTQRFGAAWFAGLPRGPGVYFFYDRSGRLLYIGQSCGLKDRIGSYRHVSHEIHPKRTLRLVANIHRIEWQLCESAAAAIERERVLLLERRPPFNRAGVWQGDPWWLSGGPGNGVLTLKLGRETGGIGPLPPSFRYVFGSIARCLFRALDPGRPMHLYPCGLMNPRVPLTVSLPLPEPDGAWEMVRESVAGRMERLFELEDRIPSPASLHEQEFWLSDRDRLVKYARKAGRLPRILLEPRQWVSRVETQPPIFSHSHIAP